MAYNRGSIERSRTEEYRMHARSRSILVCSAIALAALAVSGGAFAQQPGPDYSKVQIKATKVNGNFYTLEGSGGMIGVLAGPDGVFMVDSQFAPLTDKIVAAIKELSPAPIKFMVNTHVHGDHTGGNENLGKLGVTSRAEAIALIRTSKRGSTDDSS